MFSIAQIIGSVVSSVVSFWVKHVIIGVSKGLHDFQDATNTDGFDDLFKD